MGGRLVASPRVEVTGTLAELRRTSVAPDYQGRGLGTSLLTRVEHLIPQSVTAIELFTGERSLVNLRLYSRLGYVETDRGPAGSYPVAPGLGPRTGFGFGAAIRRIQHTDQANRRRTRCDLSRSARMPTRLLDRRWIHTGHPVPRRPPSLRYRGNPTFRVASLFRQHLAPPRLTTHHRPDPSKYPRCHDDRRLYRPLPTSSRNFHSGSSRHTRRDIACLAA